MREQFSEQYHKSPVLFPFAIATIALVAGICVFYIPWYYKNVIIKPYHNFPESFDGQVYQGERSVVPNYFNKSKPLLSNDSVNYRLPGEINGQSGHYEIFTRPSESRRTEVVTHRFFRPDRG